MPETYAPSSEIREMLKKQQGGKSNAEFAEEVGVSQQMLGAIYAAIRRPGPPVLAYLSKVLDCSIEKADGIFLIRTKGKSK